MRTTFNERDIETFIELNTELQTEIKKLREQKSKLEESNVSLNNQNAGLEIVELYDEFKNHKLNTIEDRRRIFHKLLDSVVFSGDVVKEINFDNSLPL